MAINIDNVKEEALKHIAATSNDFPVLYDEGIQFVKKLNPEGFPMVYIVDRKGRVADVIQDYCEHDFGILEARVLKVLNQK